MCYVKGGETYAINGIDMVLYHLRRCKRRGANSVFFLPPGARRTPAYTARRQFNPASWPLSPDRPGGSGRLWRGLQSRRYATRRSRCSYKTDQPARLDAAEDDRGHGHLQPRSAYTASTATSQPAVRL